MYSVIESGRHQVWAAMRINDDYTRSCPALDFLHEQAKQKQYRASARGFSLLFKRYAQSGRTNLTADLFHEVDKPNKIWQFIKGELRIFCFVHGNNVVLTHGAKKKSQKVDQKEVDHAIRSKIALLSLLKEWK